MSGDLTLDGEWVILDGHWTRVRTWDLMLDAPDRRKSPQGWRRALVHDQADGLTINYNSDYPNGVTIRGNVRVDALVGHQVKIKGEDLVLDSVPRRSSSTGQRRALVHDPKDGLTINWGSDYPGGVTINGEVRVPGKLMVNGTDIAATLQTLIDRITTLEEQVAALQPRP